MTPWELALAGMIGLVAGVLGGLAGVGGSMVMLPGLHFMRGEPTPGAHHLYMAAAMTVNIAVSIPAAVRHRRAKAIRVDLLRALLPATALAMVAGVLVGNLFQGEVLRIMLAAFLASYCISNTIALVRGEKPHDAGRERVGAARMCVLGAVTGFVGGLLGLGGGVVLVPMLQVFSRVPLRQSIATSSAVICITAVIGAAAKIITLSDHGESVRAAMLLALAMAPTAIIGSGLGARLTHALPLRVVRVVITVLIAFAAARLAGLLG